MSAHPHRPAQPVVRPPSAARSLRSLLVRGACATAVATFAWTATGTIVSAAPTPLVSAGLAGLRQGSRGADVTTLQKRLITAGIPVAGGADGVYGPATARAVTAFQKANGLGASGEVDQATADALAGVGASGGSSGTAYVGLKQGANGAAVKDIQRALVRLGVYLVGGVDGAFGSGTATGVRQFQSWNGLPVSGTIDGATAKRLGLTGSGSSARAAAPPPAAPTATPSNDTSYAGLVRGTQGSRVRALQTALQKTGLVVRGGADGVFGPATESALKVLQRVNGLAQTGVVSEREARILGLGSSSTPPTAPAASPYAGLKVGSRGQAVKDLQSALIAAGVAVRGGADGVFGAVTRSALASYQSSVGVGATGSVDAATITKLGLGSSARPAPFASNPGGSSTPPATATPKDGYVGMSVGSSGPKVIELQNALQRTGLVISGGADGQFGGATRSALMFFQKVNGMTQSGVLTDRQAKLLGLGTGQVPQTAANPAPTGNVGVKLDRFPVQGQCFFGDTWGAARGGGRTHQGVDIIAAQGKFLYATFDGTVSKIYWDQPGKLSGNGLRIAQANGTYATYLHLYSFAPGIEVGTKVKAGDVIGFVGTTGSSATPHLHFELHPGGGGPINPYPYVKAIDDCNNTTKQYQSSFS